MCLIIIVEMISGADDPGRRVQCHDNKMAFDAILLHVSKPNIAQVPFFPGGNVLNAGGERETKKDAFVSFRQESHERLGWSNHRELV